ncbi:MAG: hypothetical protein HY438_03660 [DPANN group archaeon]|nr:hypothetical protein [DPANN group archaeon]
MQPITVPLEIRNNTNGILNNTQLVINFTFFSESTAGILLYNETQTLITDSNGRLFPIINTTGLQGNTTVWLEINISNQMITPRFRITGALYAENAERLQNQTRTGLTLNNITLAGNLTHNAGGLLINSTGGINASAVGFGTIPQGVLDSVRVWTAKQNFTQLAVVNNNVNTYLNITNLGTTAAALRLLAGGAGAKVWTIHSTGPGNTQGAGKFIIRDDTAPGGGGADVLVIATAGSGNSIDLNASLNLNGNITHTIGGLLINSTGGINASAVGFGSVPVGVLNLLLSTTNTWTAAQTFSRVGLNITMPASSATAFSIYNSVGTAIFQIDTDNPNLIRVGLPINLTTNRNPSFLVGDTSSGSPVKEIFRVAAFPSFPIIVINATTYLENNLTHSLGGLLINSTGGINASAVGFGTIPQGVNQIYNDTGFTGGRVVFGKAIGIVTLSNNAEVIVNMSTGFSCTACYSVVASMANGTNIVGTFIIINMNASQFNLTFQAGNQPPFMNASWIAVGY